MLTAVAGSLRPKDALTRPGRGSKTAETADGNLTPPSRAQKGQCRVPMPRYLRQRECFVASRHVCQAADVYSDCSFSFSVRDVKYRASHSRTAADSRQNQVDLINLIVTQYFFVLGRQGL